MKTPEEIALECCPGDGFTDTQARIAAAIQHERAERERMREALGKLRDIGRQAASTIPPEGSGCDSRAVSDYEVLGALIEVEADAALQSLPASEHVVVPRDKLENLLDWMDREQDTLSCSDLCDKTYEASTSRTSTPWPSRRLHDP